VARSNLAIPAAPGTAPTALRSLASARRGAVERDQRDRGQHVDLWLSAGARGDPPSRPGTHGGAAVNVKRVHRVMKVHGLLLERHSRGREGRGHDGRVAVVASIHAGAPTGSRSAVRTVSGYLSASTLGCVIARRTPAWRPLAASMGETSAIW
jgi:hypothetical protein